MPVLKLATFNINNVVKRLSCLLEWLTKESPDIVCLQELKAPQEKFPNGNPGGRLRRHLARPEELERRRHPGPRRPADRDRARPAR